MSNPKGRKTAQLSRLRRELHRRKESFADEFEFHIVIVFVFKDNKKKCALFQAADLFPIMTNNYEEDIMDGVKNSCYSAKEVADLMMKDNVQLHAHKYFAMRQDVLGAVEKMDFHLWPRSDMDRIVCLLFSRWKGKKMSTFKHIQTSFEFTSQAYMPGVVSLGMQKRAPDVKALANADESVIFFLTNKRLQTSKGALTVVKLNSICLNIPQEKLMHWSPLSMDECVAEYQLSLAGGDDRHVKSTTDGNTIGNEIACDKQPSKSSAFSGKNHGKNYQQEIASKEICAISTILTMSTTSKVLSAQNSNQLSHQDRMSIH